MRFTILRALGRLFFCHWLCLLPLGCGAAQTTVQPVELVTRQADDKPPLVTIERDGDPHGALAMAVWAPGGERAVRALAQAVERALRRQGIASNLRIGSESLLVSVTLTRATPAKVALRLFRSGLLREPLTLPSESLVATDLCTGDERPVDSASLRASLGSRSVTFAAVGPQSVVAEVAAAYDASGEWPSGRNPDDPWPATHRYLERKAPQVEYLRIGIRLPDASRALAAAEYLGRQDSTLALLAAAQAPGFSVDHVRASLRPRGACLELGLHAEAANRRQTARLAHAIRLEIASQLERVAPRSAELLPLEAERSTAAAERAAWGAMASARPAGEPRFSFERLSSQSDSAAFEREVRAAALPLLEVVQADEAGQGRLWVLLTSRCPTVHEDSASAGHTAAALAAAARHAQGELHLGTVESWQSWRGLGLVASIPAHDAGAGARLAEALGRGLLAAASEERLIAETRRQLLGARPPSPAWEMALKLASDGHPSQLLPRGFAATAQDLQLPAATNALRRWLDGEIELAVLTNAGPGQAEQLAAHLKPLLFPLGPQSATCPKPEHPPQLSGEFSLSDADPREAVLIFPLPLSELPGAEAAAVALNGSGGWLRRAVVEPGLAGAAEAFALGTRGGRAALAISLAAEAERLDSAVMQVRALLERLASTRWTKASLKRVATYLVGARDRSDPRVRLFGLLEQQAASKSAARLPGFFRTQLRQDRLIVVRPERVLVGYE